MLVIVTVLERVSRTIFFVREQQPMMTVKFNRFSLHPMANDFEPYNFNVENANKIILNEIRECFSSK